MPVRGTPHAAKHPAGVDKRIEPNDLVAADDLELLAKVPCPRSLDLQFVETVLAGRKVESAAAVQAT